MSSTTSSLSSCPVCLGRVSSDLMLQHLASHSKEEVVTALLHRESMSGSQQESTRPLPPTRPAVTIPMDHAGIHFLASSSMDYASAIASAASSQPMNRMHMMKAALGGANRHAAHTETFPFALLPTGASMGAVPTATSSSSSTMATGTSPPIMNPIFMPHMMGMMQVMSSPCLIPQANGPPLLVNMPSYVYPNMMLNHGMTGLMGSNGALNLTQQSVLLPNQPLPVTVAAGEGLMTSRSHQQQQQTWSEVSPQLLKSLTSSVRASSSSSMSIPSEGGSCSHQGVETIANDLQTLEHCAESSNGRAKTVEISTKELAEVDCRRLVDLTSPVPGPSKPRRESRSHHHKHSSSGPLKLKIKNRKEDPLASRVTTDETLRNATPTPSSSKNTFGFTQYAQDSRYPAASLNFSSMLLEPHASPPIGNSQASQEISTNDAAASKLVADGEDSSSNNSSSNVCTVQTVTDLQNALKSEEDIQIVVPNELLETSEFKRFISTLNSFPLHEASASSSSSDQACVAPPNTPNPTRPSSAMAATEPQSTSVAASGGRPLLSPQPCSSKEVSRAGFDEGSSEQISILPNVMHDSDDDDITLQDLVAMETMEDADACEDDQFFTLSSSTNPLEPFMNAILQAPEASSVFSCDKCGLHFGTLLEFRHHRDSCTVRVLKGRKSSRKSKAKNVAFSRPPPEENANSGPEDMVGGGDWQVVGADDDDDNLIKSELIKPEIKSETQDSSCQQAALAATGQNWKCNQCKVVFETGPQLLEHLDLMRTSDHKCSSCHIIFDDRKTLIIHRRKLHPSLPKIKLEPTITRDVTPNENGEFVCDLCDRAFREKELLVRHMACHDEERPFECLECGKKFTKASLLRDHRRRHFEVGSFECGYCQKRFYTPNKLREHVRVHTGEAPLSCNICGKTFRRHSNLSEHKRTHLDNRPVKPPKELFCHCGKVFRTQRDLDWHREGEHDKQPKKCAYCGEVFVHGSSLTRHIRLKHEVNFLPENKKSSLYAACPVCQQMFYKTSINKHIKIKHQGEKPYSCDVCKASFVTKCNLLNHQWQHKGVRSRPFKCQLCKKAYLRQSLLDAHMRSHRGVKPFVCNECSASFGSKSNWQRHVAEHAGARNYECPHCQKRFSRGYYLTDHLKVHTGEKPYICGICGKMAATRSNYNSHLRTHITREPVNSEV